MAEAGAEVITPEWVAKIEDDGLKQALSSYESPEVLLEKIGYKPQEKDWREMINDEEGKKFAADSADINHLVKRAVDLRKQVSSAIFKPGKDATPAQIKAYQKQMGIPENPDGYEFPDLPVEKLTDDVKQARVEWAKQLHELGIPKDAAKAWMSKLTEDMTKAQEAMVEADKTHVKAQEAALRDEWKGDYDKNLTLANRAFTEIANRASVKLDDLKGIQTKDGRLLMDDAKMVRLFAVIGREMSEGSLGPVLSESERDSVQDELRDVRKQITEAQGEGDSKRANKMYLKEQALIAKMDGDKPIAGAAR
mgnify:CR=1 FL=1